MKREKEKERDWRRREILEKTEWCTKTGGLLAWTVPIISI